MLPEPNAHRLARWRRENDRGVKRRRNWTLAAMMSEYREVLLWAQQFAANNRTDHTRQAEDMRLLEEFYWLVEDEKLKWKRALEGECPIGFFKPSYEQAQVLNAWHPDYDPDCPEGYLIVCNFGGKRALKTSVTVVDSILWSIPNDPNWMVFTPYTDAWGREVRVFPRFQWDEWKRSGRRIIDNSEPPKRTCEMWHGCVDEGHWKEKIAKEYLKWLPDAEIARRGKDREWYMADKWFKFKHGTSVYAKLYGSEQQAWSGKELWRINLDEAPARDKLDEAIFRTTYISWSFTPADPANIGDKSALAREVYDGEYKMPSKVKFFFPHTDRTPDFAIDRKLIEQRVALARLRGEQGRVEVEGGFFDSSPKVFTHFKPEFNILPVDGETVVRAIKSELTAKELQLWPWLEKFRDANIIRGYDDGIFHVAACSWISLLQTGEKVMFKEMSLSDASIDERVDKIIDLSGNKKVEMRTTGPLSEKDQMMARMFAADILKDQARTERLGHRAPRYFEKFVREPVRKTIADSKIFRRDPNFIFDSWGDNFNRAGLRIERAATTGPAERCDILNSMMRADPTRRHLNPEQGGDEGWGAKLYFTNDVVVIRKRMERYLREQFTSGPRKGEFTGKPAQTGDDEIDSLAYCACSRMSWIDPSKYATQEYQRDRVKEIGHCIILKLPLAQGVLRNVLHP